MTMRNIHRTPSTQSGFTLLEMLLSVGILGLVMVGLSAITNDMIQQRIAQSAGQQMTRMAEITEDVILRTAPVIFGNTSALISTGGGGYPGDALRALQNNGFPIQDSNFRIANSPADVVVGLDNDTANSTLMVRVLVILKKPFPLTKATKIARAIGGRGGIIRSDFPGQIRSAFGNWTYTPANGVATNISPYMNPPAGEAYVVANISYAESDKRGPYLAREGGGSGENVMHTDLIMNGNSISNVKDIDVGTLTATKAARFDELAVNGQANFQGGIDANSNVIVKGDLSVTDGDLSVTNGDLQVPGGNISAKGLRADTLEAEDLTTKDVFTDSLTVQGGDTLITSNVTVSGGASIDITGPLKATVVDAGNITADTMRTGNLVVRDTTTLSGATTINNTTSIDQLILDGSMCLNGIKYPGGGAC